MSALSENKIMSFIFLSVRPDSSAVSHYKRKSPEHTALLHTIRVGNSHIFKSYFTQVVSNTFFMRELYSQSFGHNPAVLLQKERSVTQRGMIQISQLEQ